jgi:hypothetical protein
MIASRAGAVAEFFKNLSEGDPVAVGILIFFLVLGGGIGLFTLKVRRDMRREDEEWARKHGRKAPGAKSTKK